MIPTTSSSPLPLLNPAAQGAAAMPSAEGEAAAGAASGGFELLLDAVRQLLPGGAGGSDGEAVDSAGAGVDSGKALPPPGTILPSPVLPVAVAQSAVASGPAGEGAIEPGSALNRDEDATEAGPTPDLAALTLLLPAQSGAIAEPQGAGQSPAPSAKNSKGAKTVAAESEALAAAAIAASPLPVAVVAPPAGPAATAAVRLDPGAVGAMVKAAVAGAAPAVAASAGAPTAGSAPAGRGDKPAAAGIDPSLATASAAEGGDSAAPVHALHRAAAGVDLAEGAAATAEGSDFDALLKHFDAPAPAQPVATAPVSDASAVSPASRAYLSAASHSASVPVPVGSNGWGEAIADKVMWFSASKISSAEIHLNPPDLGPLQVRVSTQQDQASVVFTSHHAAVRDALDQALPRLRDMMGSQGMQLLDVSVGGQTPQQQSQQFGRHDAPGGGAAFAGPTGDEAKDVEAAAAPARTAARLLRAGVDAYA